MSQAINSSRRGAYPKPTLAGTVDAATPIDVVEDATVAWIEEHVPRAWRSAALRNDNAEIYRIRPPAVYREWYPTLSASGLVAPHWGLDQGGLGVSAEASRAVIGCLNRYRLSRIGGFGLYLTAPTLLAWGSEEQKARFLPPIVWDDERWCQLFSEPGAGSDLASLATIARETGDGSWRITGQKVWSSLAHEAHFGLLLARTDPTRRKREGITLFLLPMQLPGVTVRPLRHITGEAEFNEVFLDDVVVEDSYRVGPVNQGFKVAATTLAGEREMISGPGAGGVRRIGGRSLAQLIATARSRDAGAGRTWSDPVFRQRLLELWSREQALALTNARARTSAVTGVAGPEASIGKLLQSELNRDIQEAWLDLLGGGGVAARPDDETYQAASRGMLQARMNTIAGGTSEIQRNILAERILGLPREPDPYRGAPWAEVPRG